MNTKHAIFALLLTSFCGSIFAQSEIKFNIKNTKDDTLLLCYYYLENTYITDTAFNKNNKFVFRKDKTLWDGIYFITNMRKNRICEFIIDGEKNLSFKTDDSDWGKNLQCINSKKESRYLKYYKSSNLLTDSFRSLQKQKSSISKDAYNEQYKVLVAQNDSLKQDFLRDYPTDLLSKIFLCGKGIDVPQMEVVYKQDGTVDSSQMRRNEFVWYKRHYFDNIDLSCNGLLRTPKDVFFRQYDNFWSNVMKYERVDSIIYYADYLISKADKADDMKQFLIYDITRRYLTDNIMGHDKIYVYMVDKYFKTGIQTTMHPSDVDLNIQRADKWRKTLIGETVPDLACPENDTTSLWHHLDELHNKYKILIFWSVECSHCTEEIPEISKFYKQYAQKYDFGIFGVHTEGDISSMQKFVKKYDIDWVNVNGLFANYDWREYFDIEKTPIIYILDKYDKILAKNIPHDKIKEVLDILEQGGFNL